MTTVDEDFLDEQFVQDFVVECAESLDTLDQAFVDLEQQPDSPELLSAIFRTVHNLKGGSALLAFGRLESLTHLGESVLDELRKGQLRTSREIVDTLLEMIDLVRAFLTNIEASGSEGDVDTARVETKLRRHLDGGGAIAAPSSPVPAPAAAPAPEAAMEPERAVTPVVPAPRDGAAEAHPAAEQQRAAGDMAIRVDVGLLDQLMRLVGELVITRNQILQHTGDVESTELHRAAGRLDLIASELQEGVMKTRMQPIDTIWAKLPRVVRDVAVQCGKQARLVLEGRETELDRTLLEAVKDPLTHIVRNAVDHGIEKPDVRIARGKPAEGTLVLQAFHEGGQVVVEARDDGGGIDPVRVGAVAVERGLVTTDQLARMRPAEIVELVFRPGFSTAAAVTNISGRGVGMDVVRTNIEKIGGTVDLTSDLGTGTTVRVKIPLTLAIIPALVVSERGDRYAIPQLNLLELVHLEGDDLARIERLAGAPVYRLRGRLLPLVFLDEQLGLPPRGDREALNIVVLSADDAEFGLVVEDVHDTQEIVVKPLSRQLKGVRAFAGATIMGDGRISLILDVPALAGQARGDQRRTSAEVSSATAHTAEADPVLVCQVAGDRRLALPLADVSRVEEIRADQVERAGGSEVVQYRDRLLRLVRPDRLLGVTRTEMPAPQAISYEEQPMTVVVHDHGDESVGVVVEQIVDVVAEQYVISPVGRRPGLLGSAVLQDRVTDLLDVPALVALQEVCDGR